MGNKVVTRVRGLELYGFDSAAVAKECQKKFACSASLGVVAGKKEKEIVIQGHLAFELEGYLTEHCGVPRQFMAINILKGVKPKKR